MRDPAKTFEDLIVWQKADELAFQLYSVTRTFPHDELYGIVSQLRRAAVSVCSNIAEGTGRQSANETRQFLNIARGSLAEVESLLGFSLRLGFLIKQDAERLDDLRKEVGILLWRFYRSV